MDLLVVLLVPVARHLSGGARLPPLGGAAIIARVSSALFTGGVHDRKRAFGAKLDPDTGTALSHLS